MTKVKDFFSEGVAAKEKATEIYNHLVGEKEKETALSELTSASKTAIWRLWLYVFSVLSWFRWREAEQDKADIRQIVEANKSGTVGWLENLVRGFQFGHAMTKGDTDYYYETEDEAARIVEYFAYERSPFPLIKVAKAGPTAFSSEELAAIQSYIDLKDIAGPRVQVVSYDPDLLRPHLLITYDPINTEEQVREAVEGGISEYLRKGIGFNGTFRFIDMQRAILLSSTAIIDVEPLRLQAKSANSDWGDIHRQYDMLSGALALEAGFTSFIQYKADA